MSDPIGQIATDTGILVAAVASRNVLAAIAAFWKLAPEVQAEVAVLAKQYEPELQGAEHFIETLLAMIPKARPVAVSIGQGIPAVDPDPFAEDERNANAP